MKESIATSSFYDNLKEDYRPEPTGRGIQFQ